MKHVVSAELLLSFCRDASAGSTSVFEDALGLQVRFGRGPRPLQDFSTANFDEKNSKEKCSSQICPKLTNYYEFVLQKAFECLAKLWGPAFILTVTGLRDRVESGLLRDQLARPNKHFLPD